MNDDETKRAIEVSVPVKIQKPLILYAPEKCGDPGVECAGNYATYFPWGGNICYKVSFYVDFALIDDGTIKGAQIMRQHPDGSRDAIGGSEIEIIEDDHDITDDETVIGAYCDRNGQCHAYKAWNGDVIDKLLLKIISGKKYLLDSLYVELDI